jgi:hypothetical protein
MNAAPVSGQLAALAVGRPVRDLAQGNAADGAAVLVGRPGASVGGFLVLAGLSDRGYK